jgi:hypothetical protein
MRRRFLICGYEKSSASRAIFNLKWSFWPWPVVAGYAVAAFRSTPHRKPLCGLDQNKKSSFHYW